MTHYAALLYEEGDPDWSVLDSPAKQQRMGGTEPFGAAVSAVMRGARRSTPRPPR